MEQFESGGSGSFDTGLTGFLIVCAYAAIALIAIGVLCKLWAVNVFTLVLAIIAGALWPVTGLLWFGHFVAGFV